MRIILIAAAVGLCAALSLANATDTPKRHSAKPAAQPAAEPHDPCDGMAPCDLGGDFTIEDLLRQQSSRISGICVSRCFWHAAITDSCVDPDAVVKIHAPFNPQTGEVRMAAAEVLVSETKAPKLQQFLRESGAAFKREFTRLTGRDLINLGMAPCELPFPHGTFAPPD